MGLIMYMRYRIGFSNDRFDREISDYIYENVELSLHNIFNENYVYLIEADAADFETDFIIQSQTTSPALGDIFGDWLPGWDPATPPPGEEDDTGFNDADGDGFDDDGFRHFDPADPGGIRTVTRRSAKSILTNIWRQPTVMQIVRSS